MEQVINKDRISVDRMEQLTAFWLKKCLVNIDEIGGLFGIKKDVAPSKLFFFSFCLAKIQEISPSALPRIPRVYPVALPRGAGCCLLNIVDLTLQLLLSIRLYLAGFLFFLVE